MSGEFWVDYFNSSRKITTILSNYVPKEGDKISLKSKRMKKTKLYTVQKVSHSVEEEKIGKWDRIVDERFMVLLK